MSSKAVSPPPAAVGKLIDKRFKLYQEKTLLEGQIKEIDSQLSELDSEIMELLQKSGMEKAATKLGTASITTSVVAQVEDWDEFWKYIYRHKLGHLLQRRVSDPSYRELLEQGKKVPGVSPFNKKRMSFRSAS